MLELTPCSACSVIPEPFVPCCRASRWPDKSFENQRSSLPSPHCTQHCGIFRSAVLSELFEGRPQGLSSITSLYSALRILRSITISSDQFSVYKQFLPICMQLCLLLQQSIHLLYLHARCLVGKQAVLQLIMLRRILSNKGPLADSCYLRGLL